MQPLWRIAIASALASASIPVLAQSAPTDPAPAGSAAPPADPIGPPQLSNFSLGGKVTQSAQQQPVEIQPIAKPQRPANILQAPSTTAATPPPIARNSPRVETSERAPKAAAPTPSVRPQSESDSAPAITSPALPQPHSAPLTAPAAFAVHPPVGGQSGWFSSLLWLLAAAAAAGAAAWYFLWQRPRTHLAAAGVASAFEAPAAEPARPLAPTPPQAAPPATKPSGIVATRLRPWVELQFTPGRIVLDGEKALLEFEMTLFNSGSAPARDVLVEGALFNAGPMQDQQISAFFQNPVGLGNRLPLLAPLQRLSINSAIALSRAQLVPLEMEGRPLLVPLAGFNALYRWGNGSDGQTSSSYLVGKQTNGEKLAPFRLDMAPRVFRRLAAREYELRVRQ